MTLCGSQMSRRANLVLVGLTVLLVSNVAHAAPPTPITTCGFVITTPGQYYLANDLLGCPGPGIIIAASGVHLRLAGHAIQGSGHGEGIDVRGQTNILIQGPGTIAGFASGVDFRGVDFSNVIDVTAIGNQVGFFVASLPTSFSTHNVIQGNVATENDFDGIDIVGGSENRVINNLVTNNEEAINIVGSSENKVINNIVTNNRGGISLFGGNLNEVHANIVTTGTSSGILLRLSTQNNIDGNTVLGNGLFDMVDQSPDCDDNQWQGNQFDTANQPCIQ